MTLTLLHSSSVPFLLDLSISDVVSLYCSEIAFTVPRGFVLEPVRTLFGPTNPTRPPRLRRPRSLRSLHSERRYRVRGRFCRGRNPKGSYGWGLWTQVGKGRYHCSLRVSKLRKNQSIVAKTLVLDRGDTGVRSGLVTDSVVWIDLSFPKVSSLKDRVHGFLFPYFRFLMEVWSFICLETFRVE